ncbi:cupin domain-containing protein [Actinomycetospora lutea]|uniref:cupin domain-containing protein n=1 Tax=Actinomycetospora lutea TaxID=663604 RepID=UPI00236565E7|nr:cupin domain-containing protein [Actinomycetospora lutea]MDD7940296.1 cupin domain-containing protein [Actinomycetospora lutea]
MAGNVVFPGSGRAMAPGYEVKLEKGVGGGIAVFEAEHAPGSPGPPRHTHISYDEAFYVLTGTMSFDIDGDHVDCPAGSFVWIPHGAAHAFHNPTTSPASVLVVVTAEAITLVEEFLALATDGPPDIAVARELLARYDTVLS